MHFGRSGWLKIVSGELAAHRVGMRIHVKKFRSTEYGLPGDILMTFTNNEIRIRTGELEWESGPSVDGTTGWTYIEESSEGSGDYTVSAYRSMEEPM